MAPRLLHYSDIENAYDRPERIGRLVGTIAAHRDDETIVVGTGDDTAPGALALERRGRQAVPFFERVGPDAETFGNHDFDYGVGAAADIAVDAPVEYVSANLRIDGDPVAGVDPATVVERAGERVALVGVADPALSLPPSVSVTDPVAAVRETTDGLAADWVVVLAHTRAAVARDLARETPADAVLAGHVHSVARERVDDTLVVRPGANGRVVWDVRLDEPVTATRRPVPSGPLDEPMAETVRAQLTEAGLAEVVATVGEAVERDRDAALRGESRLANLATDALRWVADVDVAHVDTRGLRDGPPLGPEVTVADLVGLAPFEAGVFVATVSGRQVRSLVAESYRSEGADGRDGEVWTGQFSGLTLRRDRSRGETRVFVRDGGRRRPLDPDGDYRLATNGYVVYTDEFETVGPADARELHGLQYEAFVAYGRETGLDPEIDDRVESVD